MRASRSFRLAASIGGLLGHAGLAHAQAMPDVLVPTQMLTSLTLELHSVRDEVILYEGDPQYLLRLDLKPVRSLPPKIDFNVNNQVGMLRVRDLWLFDAPSEAQPGDEDDPDMPKDTGSRREPDEQGWEIRVAPTAPSDFVLQCDGGKATFDFTDLPVRNVHLVADTTEVEVTFDRPNLVPLDRFKATMRAGEARIEGFLNARARSATLQIDNTKCKLDLTGGPEACESEIFVEGVPRELEVTLPASAGLHIEAPSATLVRFDHKGLVRRELALESADWTERKRRIKLFLFQPIPKLTVHWTD